MPVPDQKPYSAISPLDSTILAIPTTSVYSEPAPVIQFDPDTASLFRPDFRKKQDRRKEIGISTASDTAEKISPGISPTNGNVKKSVTMDFGMETEFEERVIVPVQPTQSAAFGKRPQAVEEESAFVIKKLKKEKKEKKKKRRRKDSSESEDEWIEAPPPAKISRPKASDFL